MADNSCQDLNQTPSKKRKENEESRQEEDASLEDKDFVVFGDALRNTRFKAAIVALRGNEATFTKFDWELFNDSESNDMTLTPAGYKRLGEYISMNKCVTHMSFLASRTHDYPFQLFATAISNNRSIESLDLRYNQIGDDGLHSLIPFIAHNPSLRELFVAWNGISESVLEGFKDSGLEEICHALEWRHHNRLQPLELLDVSYNEITNEGIGFLRPRLTQGLVGKLNLCGNEIGTAGFEILSEVLRCENCCITELQLAGNRSAFDSDYWRNNTYSTCHIDYFLERMMNALASGLKINTSLRRLYCVHPEASPIFEQRITWAGLKPLLNVVCATDSIDDTYDSNHILETYGPLRRYVRREVFEDESTLFQIEKNLLINARTPDKRIARGTKILGCHFSGNFRLDPISDIKLDRLPFLLAWFTNRNYQEGVWADGVEVNEQYLPPAMSAQTALYRILVNTPAIFKAFELEEPVQKPSKNRRLS